MDAADKELAHRLAVARAYSCQEPLLRRGARVRPSRQHGKQDRQGAHCTVVTGGGPGIMGLPTAAPSTFGVETVGFNISYRTSNIPTPTSRPVSASIFAYFAMRKLHFLLRAKALVACPGGFGTFDELFEALTLVQTRTVTPIPVVLVGRVPTGAVPWIWISWSTKASLPGKTANCSSLPKRQRRSGTASCIGTIRAARRSAQRKLRAAVKCAA